ncbi:MAG: DUF4159 domain-containing protein [Kiritimatiellia bacterium]|nr:DUF4159 domain-containing protein [Kiritimatiellia bacterium]
MDDAVMYLRSCQASDGSIEETMTHYSHGAGTVMATLAMLAAGADPASDDSVQRALGWLSENDIQNTYYRAVRANVWEYALRKSPYEELYREKLEEDFDWLLKALNKKEGWRYLMTSRDWDNSVTQYGVLGIWAAARAGFDPGKDFWLKMSKHFRTCQNKDGGWSYTTGGSTANMATAGLATMFLVFDMSFGRSYYTKENPRVFTDGETADCLNSIERGMEWLGKAGGDNNDGYYLYGMERTGVASGRKYIGERDWFSEGASIVLKRQQRNGSIPMSGYGKTRVNTAFCTLFLVYGGAPVAFNKLQYAEDQDWNLNPRDLANLTKYMWSAYERPLNWHSVSIDAPVTEFEAPILFISGNRNIAFSKEETGKLRSYIERGGTIFCEPSDHSEEFSRAMVKLLRDMYPEEEYPSYKLQPLKKQHGVYTALKQAWEKTPKLSGVSNGTRTFFVMSHEYLSADWQMNRTSADSFRLAMNMLFYAVDMGDLKRKFHTNIPNTAPVERRDAVAKVGAVKFSGSGAYPLDWRAGTGYGEALAPYFMHVTGCDLEEKIGVDLVEDKLNELDVLSISGAHVLELSDGEKKRLRDYANNGGMILVNAYAGSASFAASARKEIESVFGELEQLDITSDLAIGHFPGGANLAEGVRFTLPARRRLRAMEQATRGQKLETILINRKPAVIFSQFDITAAATGVANYGAIGYQPASARKIMANILAYAVQD